MLLEAPGSPLVLADARPARCRARAAAAAGSGLRRLPHRSPRRRRRADAARSCRSSPAIRSSARPRTAGGSACRGSAGRAASAATAGRTREPLRRARASRATTSTAATPSGRSPTSGSASRCPTAFADLEVAPLLCAGLIGYRVAAPGRRRRRGSGCTASARPRTSSRRSRGPQGRRVFAFTRAGDERGAVVRTLARRRVGGLGAAAGGARRRDHLRPRRRARARRPGRGRAGRDRRLRRHPHVRHPVLPVRAALGRAHRAVGREPDAPGCRGVPGARPRPFRSGRRSRRSPSTARTRRSRSCAPVTSAARSCSCPRPHDGQWGDADGSAAVR